MDRYFVCILLCIGERLLVNGQMLVTSKVAVVVTASSQQLPITRWNINHIVDGNSNTDADNCNCCGATGDDMNSWYQVDLGKEYILQRIHVIGRAHYKLCTEGTYGQDCENTCGKCQNSKYCNGVTGECSECITGYQSPLCQDCISGRYGPICNEECGNCINNEICDKVNGNCPSVCSAGFKGKMCKEACNYGKYGMTCAQTCGKCEIGQACDNVNGTCRTCVTGYRSPMCKDCRDGRYGTACYEECGYCYNNDTCDKLNGYCPNGCFAGYQGNTCKKECENGTFGPRCQHRCGNCSNNENCNNIDGSCATCTAGYKGHTCVDECQDGTFGVNCKQRCGMCLNGDVCDIYSGECPNGCTDEYKGSQCSQKINQDTCTSSCSDIPISLPIFIGSLFAVVIMNTTIVLGLVWLFYRKRLDMKTHKAANNEDTSIPLPNTSINYDTLRFETRDGESTYTELNRKS